MIDQTALTILVIDDDVNTQHMFRTALEGENVLTASNAGEAFCLLDNTIPDVAIVDIMLPGKDGFRTMREIRDSHSACCLIATTAYYTDDTRQRFQEAGFHGYLLKPLSVESLHSYVTNTYRRLRAS